MKKSIYIYNEGQLQRKDNTLCYTSLNGKKTDLPIETISDIYIMTELTLNTAMLNLASKYEICLHFFNYYNFYTGSFYPKETLVSGNLLVQQTQAYLDPSHRLRLAKQFVIGAGKNIYRTLRYYNNRGKDLAEPMDEIRLLLEQAEEAVDIPTLMGFEGNIHQQYYAAFHTIIDEEIDFKRRIKRPPDNMMNTMISYVNSLIYTRVLSEIYRTQLNPTISFLHEPSTKRFSLCLDIAEIFKPLIGDRLIFSMLNKKQIHDKDFTRELDYMHFKKDSSQRIAAELDARLRTTIRHKVLGRDVSYEYLIRLECYKLIKDLIGEKDYDPFVIWW